MNKQDHINYWISVAEKDWEIVAKLYKSNDFVYALFFCHLVIEKLSKVVWVSNSHDNVPPRIILFGSYATNREILKTGIELKISI